MPMSKLAKKRIIILGIDPGLATTGFGVITYDGAHTSCLDYGIVSTTAGTPTPIRLETIHKTLREILRKYKPTVVAIEQLFFARNAKTAFAVGQARGVALLSLVGHRLKIVEYSPVQVKQIIVGYGRADKQQIQKMVQRILHLKELPKPDDASDALAGALCWVFREGRKKTR